MPASNHLVFVLLILFTIVSGEEKTCADKVESSGENLCPTYKHLCADDEYFVLMTQECPVTCDRCDYILQPTTTTALM